MRLLVGAAVALAACKGSTKLEVTCALDRTGAAQPSEALLAQGWSLHDRPKAPSLRGPEIACAVTSRNGVVVTVDKPAAKGRTSEQNGTLALAFPYDKLDRRLTELTFRGDGKTVKVPVPVAPRLDATVTTEGGTAIVTGTFTGADTVTLAGSPVETKGDTFTARIDVMPWLLDRMAAVDLPLGPARSLTFLLIAGTPPAADYELVTVPAPPELDAYRQALLTEGTPLPGAPPAEPEANRPTLVVMQTDTGQRLIATDPTMRVGAVELIARAKLVSETVETCRYVEIEGDPRSDYADFPAIRKAHAFAVTVHEAQTGKLVTTGKVPGTPPPPCPEFIDVPKEIDKRMFHGEMPTYDALRAWLRAIRPKAR